MTFSSSAVGTLTVSKATLEKDILLALIANTVSQRQIKVDIKTGKKPIPTELKVLNNSTSLKQRNAIIRGLCGAALLNAMDGAPYYLLGGHATAGSPAEAVALASISSWMSVASAPATSRDEIFYTSLNRHLETRAFLTPSAVATVADLDLALQLMTTEEAFGYPHVQRWLTQCHAVCTQMASPEANNGGHDFGIQVPVMAVAAVPEAVPVFFYEWEESALPKQQQQQQQQGKKAAGGADGGAGKKQAQQQQGKGGKKKEKPAKAATGPAQQAPADFDVSALDIRVGKISKVWPHEEADKLYCEEIDLGEEGGPRAIASGLRPFYATADLLENKLVLVLANLKARPLKGYKSHGMVLCASNADHTKVEIIQPPEGSKIGERVEFEGFGGKDPEPENKVAKKKIFEKVAPDLKTNAEGVVVWKDATAKTSAGTIKGMAGCQVA